MTRIGIVSDTHIPDRGAHIPVSLETIFSNVEMILHAGDITEPRALDELAAIAPVHAVRGNMDLAGTTAQLPQFRILEVEGFRIGLIHGWGSAHGIQSRIWKTLQGFQPDIIVFGHSHQPIVERVENCLWINPGSPTDRLFAPYRSVALLEIRGGKPSAAIIRLE